MAYTVEAACKVIYQDRLAPGQRPTKNMRDVVTRQCRNGTLNARKAGRKWLIEL